MESNQEIKVALVGNPNCGKTSLFNLLTGLKQKVGNFPGVTIDKKIGHNSFEGVNYSIIDLPGLYSLYPRSLDEKVVRDVLLNEKDPNHPDIIIILLDAANLKRNLYLTLQTLELEIPVIIALNMLDIAETQGKTIDIDALSQTLGATVIPINAKKGIGKEDILKSLNNKHFGSFSGEKFEPENKEQIQKIKKLFPKYNDFKINLLLSDFKNLPWLSEKEKNDIANQLENTSFFPAKNQLYEIGKRYEYINKITPKFQQEKKNIDTISIHDKLDKYLTHPIWGTLIFLLVFFLLFQAIFTLAAYPADLIDTGMGVLNQWVKTILPEGRFADFVTDGILTGIGGVVIFIPQIMILFGLITILEDTGYMARASFINDKLLEKVGMNGKSFVPLIGGFACAVPAIMAARSIPNMRERLITIFITPFMSCSARLPVYVFLIAFIIPNDYLLGFLSIQGLLMLGLYLLGVFMSIIVAIVLNKLLPKIEKGVFVMELPTFKVPRWKNVFTSMINKAKTFVFEAGKIILLVSIILWFLSSFGPGDSFKKIEKKYTSAALVQALTPQQIQREINSEKLKHSYAGIMGRFIEPAIRPLGFDWKTGIALVTSFAAREVFVGTMSTIYGIEADTANVKELKEELKKLKNPKTGAPLFSFATAFSLIIFYVFALQCMSTLAIVKKETGGWKWPIIQFFTFTGIAYLASFITYHILQ